jgi:hypothetical protein
MNLPRIPQCTSGIDLVGWKWSRVDDEVTGGGTTWGGYHLVGRYDGTRFTVTEVSKQQRPRNSKIEADFTTQCATPADGWVRDPAKLNIPEFGVLTDAARAKPDYVSMWSDRTQGVEVKTFAFTGPPAAHRAELEALWGGPLCVVQFAHSHDELVAAQAALRDANLRIQVVDSWIDEPGNRVRARVVVHDRAAQRRVDREFGRGVVKLTGILERVQSTSS